MKDGRELQRRISEGNAMPFLLRPNVIHQPGYRSFQLPLRQGASVYQDECDLSESNLSIVEFGSAT